MLPHADDHKPGWAAPRGPPEDASWPSIKQGATGGRAAWGSHGSTTFPKKPTVHLVYNAIHSKCRRGLFLWNPFPFACSQGGVLHKGRRRNVLRQGQWPGGAVWGRPSVIPSGSYRDLPEGSVSARLGPSLQGSIPEARRAQLMLCEQR